MSGPFIIHRRQTKMPRCIHFEIPAENPECTVPFYQQTFGRDTKKIGRCQVLAAQDRIGIRNGIDGAIMERSGANCVRNTISVPSVTELADKVREGGGSILTERMPTGGIGYWAVCMVTGGNTFGIMETIHPRSSTGEMIHQVQSSSTGILASGGPVRPGSQYVS